MAEVKATNFFNFRVELSNGRIFTSVLLLHKASARPSPGSEYAWGKFEMPTNLPTLLALPESKVNKLTNYLEAEKISRSELTARAIGLEGVEGYLKQIEITNGTNKTEAMKTFAFLLNGLVDTNSYPIKLTITEKK